MIRPGYPCSLPSPASSIIIITPANSPHCDSEWDSPDVCPKRLAGHHLFDNATTGILPTAVLVLT